MPGCNWLLAQDSPLILGPWGILSRFQEPPAQFLVPHSPNPADPAPAMAPGAPSSSPSSILAALLFSSLVLSLAQAIVVYTDREVHGAVGSRVTLHCSFWSSEWVSDDISFTWRYQPEGGRDAISIFHFAKGQPYIDEVGTFKERIQWVGDPRWKDGSIVIHNLDYSDNGTFTCDVKNPPDIVGKTSKVTLYVFEKGARGDGGRVWGPGRRAEAAGVTPPAGEGAGPAGLSLSLGARGAGAEAPQGAKVVVIEMELRKDEQSSELRPAVKSPSRTSLKNALKNMMGRDSDP
ncbi:PREDICTED: myelin protein P0 [Myotis davidii]|uniref:myelin protein P0 n=1 Tax=Myotis davidii TaxID=225400 RepID=UPI0007673A92|nr:PREDICTED: myelin protein P0 [Myotis davidii]